MKSTLEKASRDLPVTHPSFWMVLLSWGSCNMKAVAALMTKAVPAESHASESLSIIKVLTESHRSERDIRAARHRQAPPVMLVDDSWATGNRKKNCFCELILINHCRGFSTFRLPVHLTFNVFVITMPIFVLLRLLIWYLNHPWPHFSFNVFRFYCLFLFLLNLQMLWKSFYFTLSCEFSIDLVLLVLYVCARVLQCSAVQLMCKC